MYSINGVRGRHSKIVPSENEEHAATSSRRRWGMDVDTTLLTNPKTAPTVLMLDNTRDWIGDVSKTESVKSRKFGAKRIVSTKVKDCSRVFFLPHPANP